MVHYFVYLVMENVSSARDQKVAFTLLLVKLPFICEACDFLISPSNSGMKLECMYVHLLC